jgi:hypothetical protein
MALSVPQKTIDTEAEVEAVAESLAYPSFKNGGHHRQNNSMGELRMI